MKSENIYSEGTILTYGERLQLRAAQGRLDELHRRALDLGEGNEVSKRIREQYGIVQLYGLEDLNIFIAKCVADDPLLTVERPEGLAMSIDATGQPTDIESYPTGSRSARSLAA